VAVSATSLPFREQHEFFRRKLNLPTTGWTDIYTREHDYGFVVAGANRDDLVADFRQAVDKVITEGGTLEQFRKDFDRIVATHGWSYNGGRNWRSRVIYETNLRSSYMAGRYEQLMAMREERPYWQYIHSDAVEHPRPLHQSWNGLILRWDDPWWQTHFPINAWGCQCSVRALSDADLKRMGKSGPDTAPPIVLETRVIGQRSAQGPRTVQVPEGIDPGFEYIPGQSRLVSQIPPERPQPLIAGSTGGPGLPNRRAPDVLPTPRMAPAPLLPENLPARDYADIFLNEFGASWDQPAIFRDVIGERLVIGRELFVKAGTDRLKSMKNERGPFMQLLAQALKSPDEIWTRLEWHIGQKKAVVRRRYITQFVVEGSDVPLLAVFERGADGWMGVTTFQLDQDVEAMRIGVRLYRREE
jgi:hypothetical protein